MFKCPLCDNKYEKLISLSVHYRKGHKKKSKNLVVDLYYNGIEPICACGCGSKVKFLDITRGFREFVRGHAARVPGKNNWGNNKKAREKSQKTRKKMWKEGELQIWNKGLTKKNHPSIEQYGKNISKNIRGNKKEIKARSKRMREGRLNGTVRTLRGKEHSQWKDGTSTLHSYCHSNPILHSKWKTPKILKAKFKCQDCKKTFKRNNLHVHHNKERMCDIIRKVAKKFNWNESINSDGLESGFNILKDKISNAVAEYHIKNEVSGIVLCIECHKKEHANLNFSNTK